MKIIFTNHAWERMQERGILEAEAIECTLHPARVVKESEGIYRFQKTFRYGTIEVVADAKKNYFIIITVYPL